MLGNRENKAKSGNALMASAVRRCMEQLLETNNDELEVNLLGAYIDFSPQILEDGISNIRTIAETILDSGATLLHYEYEDIDETGSICTSEADERSKCWTVKAFSESASPDRNSGKMRVNVSRSVEKECEHGESETRMQYTLSRELQSRHAQIPQEKTTVLKISRDSDNVCLAMFAAHERGLQNARKILVKTGQRHFDIKNLLPQSRQLTWTQYLLDVCIHWLETTFSLAARSQRTADSSEHIAI